MSHESSAKKRKYELRSWVWTYYKDVDGLIDHHRCIVCSNYVKSYGSSTTELIKHLTKVHKITESTNVAEAISICMSSSSSSNEVDSDDSNDDLRDSDDLNDSNNEKRLHKLIQDQLVRMICVNNVSFQFVESPEFVKLIRLLRKSYKLPCRQTLSGTLIPKMVIVYLNN